MLSIGLWRSRISARWAPALLWIFLLVEFVGTSRSQYASFVSGVLYVVAFCTLALLTWRSPLTAWSTRVSITDLEPSIG